MICNAMTTSCCYIETAPNPFQVSSVLITKDIAVVHFVDKSIIPHKYDISHVKENTIFCEGDTEITIELQGRKKATAIEQIHRKRKFSTFGVELKQIECTIIWLNRNAPEPERPDETRQGYHNGMEAKITPHQGDFIVEYLTGGFVITNDESRISYK